MLFINSEYFPLPAWYPILFLFSSFLLATLFLRGRLPFPLPLQTVIVCLQVSSKVHNQLLQIADERAQSAEQKALELERQVSCIYLIELAICANGNMC